MISVRELIKKLQEFDPDFFVVVSGYEMGVDDVKQVFETHVKRDVWGEGVSVSYLGDHEELFAWNKEDARPPNAIYIKGRH